MVAKKRKAEASTSAPRVKLARTVNARGSGGSGFVVDVAALRARASAAHLATLEKDNLTTPAHVHLAVEGDGGEDAAIFSKKSSKKKGIVSSLSHVGSTGGSGSLGSPLGGQASSKRRRRLVMTIEDVYSQSHDENKGLTQVPTFWTARAAPSPVPPRHLCAVCGFSAPYTCSTCGARYCKLRCLEHHHETRCRLR